MAHSTSSAAATVVSSTFSTTSYNKNTPVASLGCISASASSPSHHGSHSHAVSISKKKETPNRRIVALGLAGAMVGSIWHEQTVFAAARRPPPPPPEEKKDPSISGIQAKILASKKRKEAMKESIAKLRERGKPVGPSSAE